MMISGIALSVLLGSLGVFALPRPAAKLAVRQSITTLSSSEISSFTPYSYFAAAGYCSPNTTISWICGTNCQNNPDFIPVASGGNGDSVQFWYVGYSPSLDSVIVSHQGTDTSKILPILTDGNIVLGDLDPTLFPGVDSSIQVHTGFAAEQAKTATTVLAAVQQTISSHGTSKVTLVGHSLGAAIALLDSVYLPLHLTGVTFRTITYGMPRVGNPAFADYVDEVADLTHINNKEDFVPILPGRGLGFQHPSGEVHIEDSDAWDSCPGHDNTSDLCTTGDVPTILDGDESDHDGPYNNVEMGGATCN